ncbi:MAG: LutB/LldF family L-lactate oxidation iron-sulfur protein [Bacillota bacterium]
MAAKTPLKELVARALADGHLRGAVRYTSENLYTKRQAAMADLEALAARGEAIGNFAELRARAQEIKWHTLAHLDGYLKQAAEQIRQSGGHVHWAKDAQEANQIVLEICRRRGARRVIKAKSMVSEEIHLNEALQGAGLEVVESDLGEYIIQLAKETPAHIVIPAIHKTRRQIADLFGAVAGRELATDTKTLAGFARATLRQKFMTADVGVTGANFLVAETGTICLVTNEGNGRLTTSVPPCHIALVGIEKLVPRLEDLAVLMGLLPRSATGQKITTYFNLITGPRRPGEPDGPEELHVIFLDNGRSRILATRYREVLSCIRCGACLNCCPVYRQLGGHAYGSVYPGPIGIVLTPLLQGLDPWHELLQLCSLCGACAENCPLGIQLHKHIIHLRGEAVKQGHEHPVLRSALKAVHFAWTRPGVYRFVARTAYLGARPFLRRRADGTEYLESLPSIAAGWTNTRTLPAPARKPFHQRWAELEREEGAK